MLYFMPRLYQKQSQKPGEGMEGMPSDRSSCILHNVMYVMYFNNTYIVQAVAAGPIKNASYGPGLIIQYHKEAGVHFTHIFGLIDYAYLAMKVTELHKKGVLCYQSWYWQAMFG